VGLIQENEPFSIMIDKKRPLFVPVELNKQIKKAWLMIAIRNMVKPIVAW